LQRHFDAQIKMSVSKWYRDSSHICVRYSFYL